MSIRDLHWNDSAPAAVEPGMLLDIDGHGRVLVGTFHPTYKPELIRRWAWVVKPHELDWLESMAKVHGRTA